MIKVGMGAFALGFFAVVMFLYVGVTAMAIYADAQGLGSFGFGGGMFTVFEYERTASMTGMLYGPGIIVVGFLAGVLNSMAALALRARMLTGAR